MWMPESGEYRQARLPTPLDGVAIQDYFDSHAFLPLNAKRISNVQLRFAPTAEEVTYGESRIWSPLNILGGIYLTIYNNRSAQHFDMKLLHSGNPPQLIDREAENKYPFKVYQ